MGRPIKELCEGKKRTGRENGDNEDNRDRCSKPARGKQREQEDKELVSSYGSPVEHGVKVVGRGVPVRNKAYAVKENEYAKSGDKSGMCLW
jgi:hypothetical protein